MECKINQLKQKPKRHYGRNKEVSIADCAILVEQMVLGLEDDNDYSYMT
jgi:hypothetical protein